MTKSILKYYLYTVSTNINCTLYCLEINKCMSLEIDLVSLFTIFLFTKYHFPYQAGPRSVTKVPLVLFKLQIHVFALNQPPGGEE